MYANNYVELYYLGSHVCSALERYVKLSVLITGGGPSEHFLLLS